MEKSAAESHRGSMQGVRSGLDGPNANGQRRAQAIFFAEWTGAAPFRKPPPFVSMAVSRILFSVRFRARIDGHLSCPLSRTPALRRMRLLPGVGPACAGQGRRPVPPVLSCTAWGLSCAFDYSRAGGLLPRLFTLTIVWAPPEGVLPSQSSGNQTMAVCFL